MIFMATKPPLSERERAKAMRIKRIRREVDQELRATVPDKLIIRPSDSPAVVRFRFRFRRFFGGRLLRGRSLHNGLELRGFFGTGRGIAGAVGMRTGPGGPTRARLRD